MSNEVRQILEDQLILAWGTTTPITWDDDPRVPRLGVDFIRCTLDGLDAQNISIKCQRENYLFTVQVFTKADKGSESNMALVDLIKKTYFGFSRGTLICKSVIDERVGAFNEFYQRNVLIDIQYDNHVN